MLSAFVHTQLKNTVLNTIAFAHIRNTDNIGDRWCCPYDYFVYPNANAIDLAENPASETGAVIYGGGKILGSLHSQIAAARDRKLLRIGWGLSSVQSSRFSLKYFRSQRLLDLIGTRDWGDSRFSYAPCVSCMSGEFDSPAPPQHELVFYLHAGKTDGMGLAVPEGVPVMTNTGSTFEEALRFIASGATVISNSYHGVYWTMLMGRRSVCIPFSNKFTAYRLPPSIATVHNWRQVVNQAQAHDEFLSLSREATMAFKSTVDQRLSDVGVLQV